MRSKCIGRRPEGRLPSRTRWPCWRVSLQANLFGGGTGMRRLGLLFVIALLAVALVSCAPGPNPAEGGPGDVAGFWQGLWHGFIVLFTFVISLFNGDVGIYEVSNNGGWYNFGYLLGVMIFWGGGGGGAAKGAGSR
jgi:hypothetical protein